LSSSSSYYSLSPSSSISYSSEVYIASSVSAVNKAAGNALKKGKGILAGIIAGAVVAFLLIISGFVYCWYRCVRKTVKSVAVVAKAAEVHD
jgi:small-conductance mechanosensitive channel